MTEARTGLRYATDGFTLVEALITLAIIALVASLAAPNFAPLHRAPKVSGIAGQIAAGLQLAHTRAISTAREQAVVISPREILVQFQEGRRILLPAGWTMTALVGRETIDGDRQARILFRPDGTSSGAEITISDGKGSISIQTSWLTGITSTKAVLP